MTTPQITLFWREWAKTCRAMNWTKAAGLTPVQIDTHRRELLARLGFDSLTKVDHTKGFDRVLNELRVLQGVSVDAGMKAADDTIQDAERLRHVILTELVPCLELYVADVRAFIGQIILDKNRWWKLGGGREITIMDLDNHPVKLRDGRVIPGQLEQLRMTLNARLNDKRREAGDSMHDMKIRAGVPCDCARICRQRLNQAAFAAANAPVPEPVPEPEHVEQPF